LSRWVKDIVRGIRADAPAVPFSDPFDDDLQLALYCCYEAHFTTLPEAVDDLEWDLELLRFRRELEWVFELGLRGVVGATPDEADIGAAIPAMLAADDGPSLSLYMATHGTLSEMRDFVVHRSAYQLKEADGHTFGIPRLSGVAKQMLVQIQAGEYGADGIDREMHASLFAQTMRELGLDDRRNAYLGVQPGSALAISNLISMFGLHRRWRGALVGHLAVFEMTSVVPMGRYASALDRLGASAAARRFYDVHVLADAEHETMALELAGTFAADEPALACHVMFGASCAIAAEHRFAAGLLRQWGVDPAEA
jgi:Iron-containing redox enzyme